MQVVTCLKSQEYVIVLYGSLTQVSILVMICLQSLDSSKDETKSEKADDSVSEVDTESEQGTPGGTSSTCCS